MGRILKDSFNGDVKVWKQFGPHDVRAVPVPCMIAMTLDVDELLARLGERALKSKGQRATAFYGALVVEVREIKP